MGTLRLREEADLVMYIDQLLHEPCGRSVPGSIYKAVAFFECAAEIPMDKRLTQSMAIQHDLMEVEASGSWKPHQRAKAQRVPLGMGIRSHGSRTRQV